jgi:hypothetical protein
MLRLAIYYEGATIHRNDGNALYINGILKRTQYFCEKMRGVMPNEKLLQYFNDGNNPQDPQAVRIAEWANSEFGGLEIEHLRPDGNLKPWGEFDYHLWVDWGEDALTQILGYVPKVPEKNLIYWASDTHLGYSHRRDMCKRAEIAFVAQKRAKEEMAKEGIETTWLPHAVEPLAYNKGLTITKKYDCRACELREQETDVGQSF